MSVKNRIKMNQMYEKKKKKSVDSNVKTWYESRKLIS